MLMGARGMLMGHEPPEMTPMQMPKQKNSKHTGLLLAQAGHSSKASQSYILTLPQFMVIIS